VLLRYCLNDNYFLKNMELKQLKYFVAVVDCGTMSQAAIQLDMVQPALSQQISRLETELSTRLLNRSNRGVSLTEPGVAFYREAVLALRHAEEAARVAKQARLTGSVSIGLSPSICALVGLPLMLSMKEKYPDVRLHIVEGMSGHLTQMLNARQIDLAILFNDKDAKRWSVTPLLQEKLFVIGKSLSGDQKSSKKMGEKVNLQALKDLQLILPTSGHGLRQAIDRAFANSKLKPKVVAEIDSLDLLMSSVVAGLGHTIQPWGAVVKIPDFSSKLAISEIKDQSIYRPSLLCSLSDDELSPSALAARVLVKECVETLAISGAWKGSSLLSGYNKL
jgi:LysR family transcriptional regulator, regulatory protein for tcuABC